MVLLWMKCMLGKQCKCTMVFDGISARDNPLILAITTAGTIRNSVYDIKYEESENIINGLWKMKDIK